jgi:hypothetical protein
MADKRITFSLDLSTDQAKRAIDDFTSQLARSAQDASAPLQAWNKIGEAISDSFRKALQDVKGLQEQIREEMRRGASSILQPGSQNSLSGKLVDGLKEMIKSEHETVKTAIRSTEQELAKNRDEYAKMVRDLGSKTLDQQMASDMNAKQQQINQLQGQLQTKTQAAQVLSTALSSGSPQATQILQQLAGGGAAPPPPPPPAGGGGAAGADPFQFAGKAGALLNLIAGQGNLTSLISGGGLMSLLSAAGGTGGAVVGTTLFTADALIKGSFNQAATEAALTRQFATGGASSVTAGLLARQAMKAAPTGAFGRAQAGEGLGFIDFLDQMRVFVQSGFSSDAAGSYIREKLLQEQMGGFGVGQERAFQGAIDRRQALHGVERMFGMGASGRAGAMMAGGIPLDRLGPGMAMMAEFMGRMPQGQGRFFSASDAALINFQNRFGLSDDAARQVFRASAANSGAAGLIQGMMGAAGLGTPGTDIATGRVMGAGAGFAASFDAAAAPGAMGTFMQGFSAVSGALPGLSSAEQSRYSNAVTGQRLQELNNPESLANRTAMGTLARLGITDPVEARVIMSMGLEQGRTVELISKMTGRSADDVRSSISGGQRGLEGLQRARFGGGKLDQLMGEGFTFNALRAGTGRDVDAVRAQGAFNVSDMTAGGPSAAQIEVGRGVATGRQDTTVDVMNETNARIAGSLALISGVVDGNALRVKIVEGGREVQRSDAENEARRKAEAAARGISTVSEPRTNRNVRQPGR